VFFSEHSVEYVFLLQRNFFPVFYTLDLFIYYLYHFFPLILNHHWANIGPRYPVSLFVCGISWFIRLWNWSTKRKFGPRSDFKARDCYVADISSPRTPHVVTTSCLQMYRRERPFRSVAVPRPPPVLTWQSDRREGETNHSVAN